MEFPHVELMPSKIRNVKGPIARKLSTEEKINYEKSRRNSDLRIRNNTNYLNPGESYFYEPKKTRFHYYRNFNFFDIIFLNQTGTRTATLPELSDMVNIDNILLKDKHTFGPEIVLRKTKDPFYSNQNLSIFNTLKDIIGLKRLRTPYILRGLKLEKDESNEQYGFSVVPGDNFQFFRAPDFSTKNHKRNIKRINPDYSIEWAKEGEKNTGKLYSSPEMISPIFVNEYLDVGSGFGNFEFSNENSTVIAIEDFKRDRTKNREDYLVNIIGNLQKQEKEHEEKYKKLKLKYKSLNEKYKKSLGKIRKQK